MYKRKLLVITLIVFGFLAVSVSTGFTQHEHPDSAWWNEIYQDVFGSPEIDFGGATVYWPRDAGDSRWGPAEGIPELAKEMFNIGEIVVDLGTRDEEWIMSRILAGDAKNEMYFLNNAQLWPMLRDQMLYPVSDVVPLEYWDHLPAFDAHFSRQLTLDDRLYGFGSTEQQRGNRYYCLTYYNKDILEELGLPDPYQLWQEGEWTWEAFTKIAVAATRDTTGDGEIDQWGMHAMSFANAMILAAANGARVTEVDERGRVAFNLDSPEALEALEQWYEWDNELEVTGPWWETRPIMDGYTALHIGQGFHLGNIPPLAREAGINYGLAPIPWGPSTQEDYFGGYMLRQYFVPITVENPEAMVLLHGFLKPADGHDNIDEHWRYISMTRDHMEFNQYMYENQTLEHYNPFAATINDILHPAFDEIQTGAKTPAVAMEEIRPAVQSALDDLLDQ